MITDEQLMMYAGIGIFVAAIMAIFATIIQLRIYKPIRRLKQWFWQRALDRHLMGVEEVGYAEDQARTDVMMLEMELNTPTPKPYNYRHNIHCICGKFAKKVVLGGVVLENTVECHEHGVIYKWKDEPVDWATIAVAQVDNTPVAVTEMSPVPWVDDVPDEDWGILEPEEEPKDFTGSIAIVIDDRRALSMI